MEKKIKPGTIETLVVKKREENGYTLTDGFNYALLHFKDIEEGKEVELHEKYDVFLYTERRGRMNAKLELPNVTLKEYGWTKVSGMNPRKGIFVDLGNGVEVIVDKSELPEKISEWPILDDELYITIDFDREGKLYGKLAKYKRFFENSDEAEADAQNKDVNARVFRIRDVGANVITDDNVVGFIHNNEQQEPLRLGQEVTGRVIDVKEDATINMSMLPRTHEVIDENAEKILSVLEERDGSMPYWDKSDPEDIRKTFDMSKSSFKRGIGNLLKQKKIYQEEGWTYLKK
jgi:uncharacterized protein